MDVERALASVTGVDLGEMGELGLEGIGAESAAAGNPIVPMVEQLPEGAHAGATQ